MGMYRLTLTLGDNVMNEKSKANIYDVAKAAGVSIATVSRVLSGSTKVSPVTRERVMEAVDSVGFMPNAFARGLGTGSMKMVGILCTDVSDLYYGRAVSALERLLRGKGFDTLLYCTGTELADKQRFISQLLAKNVDAIMLVGSAFKEQYDNSHLEQAAGRVPVLIINGLIECENTYCVLCDEKEAMRDNVRLLYEHGCRDILYLYHASTYSSGQKLAGLLAGLADCGLPNSPRHRLYCERDVDGIEEMVGRFLDSGLPADGVLTTEDLLAVGAGKALASRGIRIPVLGFDDSLLAECATPSLSSVDNRCEELCEKAAEILSQALRGEKPPSLTVLPARLVERESFRRQVL